MTQSLTGDGADKVCSWIDVGGEGKERNQDGFYVCSLGNGGCGAFTETGKMGVGAGYLEGSKPIQAVKAHKLPR